MYQFKITLKGIKAPIWRRIQVPETYIFWDLHVAIQDAMGWEDYNCHGFELVNPLTGSKQKIGIPDEVFDRGFLTGWRQKIAGYFSMANRTASYDFDDPDKRLKMAFG